MKEREKDYLFEQFRVERGCLGYVAADPATTLAAVIDPEAEMAESMLDCIFEHGLKPACIIDTHTHADHCSGGQYHTLYYTTGPCPMTWKSGPAKIMRGASTRFWPTRKHPTRRYSSTPRKSSSGTWIRSIPKS